MSPKTQTLARCEFVNVRGHRCRMLVDQHHNAAPNVENLSFCAFHSQRTKAAPIDPEILADELLAGIKEFDSAKNVNLFLGNLAKQLARKRIPTRRAVALAYISQLLLSSLPAVTQEAEMRNFYEGDSWVAQEIRRRRALEAERWDKDHGFQSPQPTPGTTNNSNGPS